MIKHYPEKLGLCEACLNLMWIEYDDSGLVVHDFFCKATTYKPFDKRLMRKCSYFVGVYPTGYGF